MTTGITLYHARSVVAQCGVTNLLQVFGLIVSVSSTYHTEESQDMDTQS